MLNRANRHTTATAVIKRRSPYLITQAPLGPETKSPAVGESVCVWAIGPWAVGPLLAANSFPKDRPAIAGPVLVRLLPYHFVRFPATTAALPRASSRTVR